MNVCEHRIDGVVCKHHAKWDVCEHQGGKQSHLWTVAALVSERKARQPHISS
jgi:hypothetical protein